MVQKLSIDNKVIAEEFFEDVQLLLGIQSTLEPHQFVWLVNKHFLYDFRYQAESEVLVKKKGRDFSYPIFKCKEPHLEVTHYIYTNHHDGEYLLQEIKHLDYLWLTKGDQNVELAGLLLNEIKSFKQLQLVTELASEKIIHKQQLVL